MRWTVTEEPRGPELAALLRAARGRCATALLVVRDQLPLDPDGAELLRRLAPRTRRASRWPGTELLGSEADVHEFAFDDAAVELLTAAVDGLFGWQQPALPEDLCLLTAGGEPWLVTIAHEADAYVELGEGDLAMLEELAPAFAASLRPDAGS